jgi:D-glycero-beta-D-manno-heptose 1-phosphate adenylyltransferase
LWQCHIIINKKTVRRTDCISEKIISPAQINKKAAQWRLLSKKIAFTNGVFDILHQGHIYSLSQAAKEADYLIVGLNSDASVKRLKGETRPINNEESRALVLASLLMVDAVVIFEEDTPLELIKAIMPDVLIKGGDYTVEQIAGAKEVIENGGRVVINPMLEGFSTTSIIDQKKSNPD